MVKLHHGSIVPVIELFEENGLFYLVMEYVPGRDLKAVLRAPRPEGVHALSCTLGRKTRALVMPMEKMIQMADHSASFIEM